MLQPISVIKPIVQGQNQCASLNTQPSTTLLPPIKSTSSVVPLQTTIRPRIQRNQSFHGFQNQCNTFLPQTNINTRPIIFQNNPQNIQFKPNFLPTNYRPSLNPRGNFIPSIFYNLPQSFTYMSGNNTIAAIGVQSKPNPFMTSNLLGNQALSQNFLPNITSSLNSFNSMTRVMGRKELNKSLCISNTQLAKTSKVNEDLTTSTTKAKPMIAKQKIKLTELNENRFSSLEIRKHKCYSPTFYSVRCKKHGKRRSIIYALPKKHKSLEKIETCSKSDDEVTRSRRKRIEKSLKESSDFTKNLKETNENKKETGNINSRKKQSDKFENLTDSIQIQEQNAQNETLAIPQPAPRSKSFSSSDLIYANLNKNLNTHQEETLDSSNDNTDCNSSKISVTEALVHSPKENSDNQNVPTLKRTSKSGLLFDDAVVHKTDLDTKTMINPFNSKQFSNFSSISPFKNTPTLKVSPNFIKPKVESPKGALQLQLQAKMRASNQNLKTEKSPNTHFEKSEDLALQVPKMPLLHPKSPSQNKAVNKVCFASAFFFFCFAFKLMFKFFYFTFIVSIFLNK